VRSSLAEDLEIGDCNIKCNIILAGHNMHIQIVAKLKTKWKETAWGRRQTRQTLSSACRVQLVPRVPVVIWERVRVRMESEEDLYVLPNPFYYLFCKETEL